MENKKTIWFDITNVPHVNFFMPLIKRYEGKYNLIFSIRDFAETKSLFKKKIGEQFFEVGHHVGNSKIKKIWASFTRIFELNKTIPYFDVKISCGGDASSVVAKLRHKLSITFDDNEKAPNWRYAPFSDLAFWPSVIPTDVLVKQCFNRNRLYKYNGFKEDFYLADYQPNLDFINTIPFEHYVVVRAENIKANYVEGKVSIVPELLEKLEKKGYNILFLPRYKSDYDYAKNTKNVYIPNEAINGLDACYFSDAVLTGAGTMAREAACLGIPSVSFFAGSRLLTVDSELVKAGRIFFSRNVDEIISYLDSCEKRIEDLGRAKLVQNEIFDKLDLEIESYFDKHK